MGLLASLKALWAWITAKIYRPIVVGALVVVIFIFSVMVSFGGEVRISVQPDKTVFYIYEDYEWKVSGIEYNRLYDENDELLSTSWIPTIQTDVREDTVRIRRTTPYWGDRQIIDEYFFNGSITDKELFPIRETKTFVNSEGLNYIYMVTGLSYSGPTKYLSGTSAQFGKMKVVWDDRYEWARISSEGTLEVSYLIDSNYVVYNIRLFDPTDVLWVNSCDDSRTEWETMTNNPYLDDNDGSSLYEDKTASMEAGDFGFVDTSTCDGLNIDEAVLYFECLCNDGTDGFTVYLNTGAGFSSAGNVICTSASYQYETLNVIGIVDTSAKADALTMYLDTYNDGGGDDRYVRRAYLNLTCSADTNPPDYEDLSVNATNQSTWGEYTYNFSSVWNDADFSSATIEWEGTNITATCSGASCYYLADGLSVGVYNYRWFGNDTNSNENVSSFYSFEIIQADTNITDWINTTQWEGTYSYEYPQTIVANGTLNVSAFQASVNCYFNGTSSDNPNTTQHDEATYLNWSCYYAGNANYSASAAENRFLEITAPDNDPYTTLDSPGNDTTETSTTVDFVCTSYDDNGLENVTLYFMDNGTGSGETFYTIEWTEDFETGWTPPELVGANADWFDDGAGPTVTDDVGVTGAGDVGLVDAANIFIWSAKVWSWSNQSIQSIEACMDMESSATGTFDDDRVGWQNTSTSVSSNFIFGVQMDVNATGEVNLVGYWDGHTTSDIRAWIVPDVQDLVANTWYRLCMNMTPIGIRSLNASMLNVTLYNLTAAGEPDILIAEGGFSNISDETETGAEAPSGGYFIDTLYPSYKNFETGGITGEADNTTFAVTYNQSGISGGTAWHANETKDITGTDNTTTFTKTLTENLSYTWTCYPCDDGNQCNETVYNFTFYVQVSEEEVDQVPTVTLVEPTNGQELTTVTSSRYVDINCTATDDYNITNISVWGNWSGWHRNWTNTTSGTWNFSSNNITLNMGDYLWGCEACDNASNCSFNDPNWTFTISEVDLTYPNATLNEPEDDSTVTDSLTVTFNFTARDNNALANATLYYNQTSGGNVASFNPMAIQFDEISNPEGEFSTNYEFASFDISALSTFDDACTPNSDSECYKFWFNYTANNDVIVNTTYTFDLSSISNYEIYNYTLIMSYCFDGSSTGNVSNVECLSTGSAGTDWIEAQVNGTNKIYIYNDTASAWTVFGSEDGNVDTTDTANVIRNDTDYFNGSTYNFTDYINDTGFLRIIHEFHWSPNETQWDADMGVDFVYLEVNYDDPTAGYTWEARETIDLTGTDNTTITTATLTNGTYLWNIYVCDTASLCNWSTPEGNFTFELLYSPPSPLPTWCAWHFAHTEYSDGAANTPDETLARMKDFYDCGGSNDHDTAIDQTEWDYYIAQANSNNTDNEFTYFFGLEWSDDTHHVYYIINGDPPATQIDADDAAIDTFPEFADWLEENGGIGQHNHPARSSTGTDFTDANEVNETYVPTAAMINNQGGTYSWHWNYWFNCSANSGCTTYQNPKTSGLISDDGNGWVKVGLDLGQHIGFTCGNDKHEDVTTWTPECYVGLIDPYNFTRNGVFRTWQERHTWASTNRMLIDTDVNNGTDDMTMGDIFNTTVADLQITYTVNTTEGATMENISLFVDGIIVNVTTFSGSNQNETGVTNYTIAQDGNEHYAFFMASDSGDNRSWSSPMFITYTLYATPQPVFVSPTLGNNTQTQNESWIYVNVSAGGQALDTCILEWDPPYSEYTPTTELHCDGGICTKTLYSGMMYVYEDEEWKTVQNARNLTGLYEKVYLEYDPDYEIEIEQYNYTHLRKMKLKSEVGGQIPFKINGETFMTHNFTAGEEYEIEEIEVENILAYNFTLGNASTTIQLWDADTDNLRDTYVEQDNPSADNSGQTYVKVEPDSGIVNRAYLMFNLTDISEVPTDDIIDATLALWSHSTEIDNGTKVTIAAHHIMYNDTWTEFMNWNTQVCGSSEGSLISTECNTTPDNTTLPIYFAWNMLNVTNMVKNESANGDMNVSMLIMAYEEPNTYDYILFRTKEYGTVSERPYLNITYQEEKWQNYTMTATDNNNLSFWYNQTGLTNQTSYYFRVWCNATNGLHNETEDRNITVNLTDVPAVGDSCDTCTMDFGENCEVDTLLDCGGGPLIMVDTSGPGTIIINANIVNWNRFYFQGGFPICNGGCWV